MTVVGGRTVLEAAVDRLAGELDRWHTPGAVTSYAGRFTHPGYGELLVSFERDVLSARMGELDFSARHRQLDTWELHYDPLDVRAPLTFLTGPDGSVDAVTLRLDGEEPVTFMRVEGAGE